MNFFKAKDAVEPGADASVMYTDGILYNRKMKSLENSSIDLTGPNDNAAYRGRHAGKLVRKRNGDNSSAKMYAERRDRELNVQGSSTMLGERLNQKPHSTAAKTTKKQPVITALLQENAARQKHSARKTG